MAVATAVVGGAVIAGTTAVVAAKMSSDASDRGAKRAINAQLEATRMQVEEARRQHEAQMEMIRPLAELQTQAGQQFRDLMGEGAGRDPRTGAFVDRNMDPTRFGAEDVRQTEFGRQAFENTLAAQDPNQDIAIARARDTALYQGIDRDTAVQQARGRQLAGTPLEEDIAYGHVQQNLLAAPSMAEDERFQFAQDTALVGEEFETSPGYEFAVEEAMKAVDRNLSRGGGNYGGRAILEAQRRAEGLARQDYYNWLGARRADLGRQDVAAAAYQQREAIDTSRMDQATLNYLQRMGIDIGREDQAVYDARRRQEMDIARGDVAMQNYLGRRAGDITRQDQAAYMNLQNQQYDQARQDQAYANYLNMMAAASGVTQNPIAMGVQSSARMGQGIQNAYGQQGGNLAGIYFRQGENQASAVQAGAAGVNQAFQSGAGNYLMMGG